MLIKKGLQEFILYFFKIFQKKLPKSILTFYFLVLHNQIQKYDEFEIFDSRETLKKALSKKNSVHEFLSLNNDLLDTGVLDISRAKLIKLLSMYFNEVKGMGYDNIKLLMTGKKRLDS